MLLMIKIFLAVFFFFLIFIFIEEEMGGAEGMGMFVKTPTFKKMNVGFSLDEGYANPTEKFTVFYGERATRGKHSFSFIQCDLLFISYCYYSI